MEYQLEIHRPGTYDSQGCIKTFTAAAPFFSIRIGDLLNTKTWDTPGKMASVAHRDDRAFDLRGLACGIDPVGRITQRILLYTESVPDTAETRCKALLAIASPDRKGVSSVNQQAGT